MGRNEHVNGAFQGHKIVKLVCFVVEKDFIAAWIFCLIQKSQLTVLSLPVFTWNRWRNSEATQGLIVTQV